MKLAQHIQAFLHKHDRPLVSLYEEMVERQREEERKERERKEKERQLSRIKEEEQVQWKCTLLKFFQQGEEQDLVMVHVMCTTCITIVVSYPKIKHLRRIVQIIPPLILPKFFL